MSLSDGRPSSTSSTGSDSARRPRVLGRQYELLKRLGQGSFGIAYLVRDIKAHDSKELKVLKEIFIGDKLPDNGLDAVREAKLLSKLSHPNIVKYNTSFVQGEVFCIVTEYCDNGDLSMVIKRVSKEKKRFEEKLVATYLVQLLMAIKYMHDRKLLHRDIKTGNIFLRNNVIKLGDFGITRLLEHTSDMASTFTGTPNYMSPEVVQHQGYNAKSDIWSVGCVLYEMCALVVAFKANNLLDLMKKIVYEDAPTLPPGYSQELGDVFEKTMTKDSSQRSSATSLLRHHYIVKHVSTLKEQIVEQNSAEQDSSAIAEALSGYSHSRKERRQEVKSRAETTSDTTVSEEERLSCNDDATPSPSTPVKRTAASKPTSAKKTPSKAAKSSTSKAKSSTPVKPKAPLSKHSDQGQMDSPKAAASPAKPAGKTPKKKAEKLPAKKMTPKEQLQLRKRQKADEEAGRLRQEVRKHYSETQQTYARNKGMNIVKRPPPWVAENPDVCNAAPFYQASDDITPQVSPVKPPLQRSSAASGGQGKAPTSREVENRDLTFVSQLEFDEMPVGMARAKGTSPPAKAASEQFYFEGDGAGRESINITFSDLTLDNTLAMVTETGSPRGPANQQPPGQPARGALRVEKSKDMDDSHYIPEDPDEAYEHYTQGADFDSDSDDEPGALSNASSVDSAYATGVRSGKNDNDDDDDSDDEDGRYFDSAEEDRDDMVDLERILNNVLELTMMGEGDRERDAAQADVHRDAGAGASGGGGGCGGGGSGGSGAGDVLNSSDELLLSPQQRKLRLRASCIQLLGEEAYQQVYKFLQDAHFGAKPLSQVEIHDGLARMVPRVRDCFLVEQLIFLEQPS